VCVCKLFLSANVSECDAVCGGCIAAIIGFMDSLGSVVALVTASQGYCSTGSYVRASLVAARLVVERSEIEVRLRSASGLLH
jgi:hypothetical protein